MTDVEQVAYDVLNEMYEEAEPPLDFEDARNNPENMPDDWYEHHYLDAERQQKIVEKHAERANLTNGQHTSLVMTCMLDLGPTGSREVMEENQNE